MRNGKCSKLGGMSKIQNQNQAKKKGVLQKTSNVLGIICFPLALVCGVFLYFKVQEVGMQHPVSASFLASAFFFVFIGVVFTIMGNADIPSFKVGNASPPSPPKDEN